MNAREWDEFLRDTGRLADEVRGYRCQWCEQPCSQEENQRGECDECSRAYEQAERLAALLDQMREAA